LSEVLQERPQVSIIVPCYNEEGTIQGLLHAIYSQDYPLESIEVIIADGMSEDGTRTRIHEFIGNHPGLTIRIVDNPERSIPNALNQALEHSKGSIVIRLDAHSVPAKDYISKSVGLLEERDAANVGGVWLIKPSVDSPIAKGIAAAAAHPLGAGGARYRIGGKSGEVETVPFGAFQREWLKRVGPFNEQLLSNEDFEYNARIRQAGGVVWFDPSIRSVYYARATFPELAKQYWRYGFWKARMLRLYPTTLHWRQVIPPLFVSVLFITLFMSLFFPVFLWFFTIQLFMYVLITIIFGFLQGFKRNDPGIAFSFPIALWIMHFSWGSGFLWSLFSS
jgi:cellulose synthase/poly-beta-1,6-N-acetylglucosamine synthase-like glycosyltransferase